MKSYLGTLTALQEAGVYFFTNDLDEAKVALQEASILYKGLKVKILNLANTEERLEIVEIDPDMASEKSGYAVVVKVPDMPV
ncbi:hypothetical protein BFU36_05200 [Sulfolobus sp. A20]|uniref:hypothetical protein n=1 Tax=Sulfolobaceae TaxID=118883 RepID=UPI000845E3C8|nr:MULTISPECIES: hypothetical protein [unclassified Sulfolobus]TRM74040.1 hypothetical protein DJ532_13835 [Sulfolobus sp. A20-N-F8]TRM82544.1 hypothetical protein DJ524_00170 [Sulfolobus sp. D5]TRN01559.1 hypothetical protein DJ527_05165 [Sulfolobus sp. F1]AOL16210.1 hypothetical protein BFU36_05200 [Sulfolobus sp. A20]TRM96741.1 hypothetical protein DMP16_05295 [Sulfolobus sp. B1]